MGQFTIPKVSARHSSRVRRRMYRRSARRPRRVVVFVLLFAVVFGGLFGSVFIGLRILMAGQADLPNLAEQQPVTEAQTSQLFAADGSTLAYLFGEENRTIVNSQDISPHLKKAIVAIEDHRFYQHNGVDYEGLGRAVFINIKSRSFAQGASTITQQLVGSLFLDRRDISVTRKIKEASLALEYEKKYTKDEILTQYLNTVYFGANAYGAEAAAQTYFGKSPKDLTIAEAALLAGLPQAPSAYNPRLNPQKALNRRNEVLEAMWEVGYISEEECDQAEASPIQLAPYSPYTEVREPYVVDYVKQQLFKMFGKDKVFKGGLRVETTIEPRFQELARKAIQGVLDREDDPAAALVSVDPKTGYIRAMASSGDYGTNKFNLAAQSHRQAGSAFKPFCLVAALEQGMDPVKTVYRSGPQSIRIPGTNEIWNVGNFGGSYYGASNLVDATVHSDNSIYAQLIMDVGVKNVADVAHRMGITSPINLNPPIVLGGLTYGVSTLDMASAYGTLATEGVHVEPTIITRIWDASGKLIWEHQPKATQAVSAKTAYTATQILQENVKRGTGKRAEIGRPSAGKTGTASDFSDAWYCGYTPNLSTAVWVGHPEGRVSMVGVHGINVTGGSFPAMIWHDFMYEADRTYPLRAFPSPGDPLGLNLDVTGTSDSTSTSETTSTTGGTSTTGATPRSGRTTTTSPQVTTTTAPPTTSPPTTAPPTTAPPTTAPPTTAPPTTAPPTTAPPNTSPPATTPPNTSAPAAGSPAAAAPVGTRT